MALVTGRPVLLLETTGRRSGRPRYTPVAYWRTVGGSPVVGGGAAGMPQVDWVANLRSRGEAAVWVHRRRQPVVATELTGEYGEWARRHTRALWPETAWFERRSGRPIPCFRLDRPVERPPG